MRVKNRTEIEKDTGRLIINRLNNSDINNFFFKDTVK